MATIDVASVNVVVALAAGSSSLLPRPRHVVVDDAVVVCMDKLPHLLACFPAS